MIRPWGGGEGEEERRLVREGEHLNPHSGGLLKNSTNDGEKFFNVYLEES